MSGRKTKMLIVPTDWGGRDAGKRYFLTEMSAARAEKWGMRAFLLLQASGAQIPNEEQLRSMGMVGVAIATINVWLQASIRPEDLEPLLDEMMTCVQMIRDPNAIDRTNGGPVISNLISDDDIEEVQTRLWLRSEVLELHTGFSPADALSALLQAIKEKSISSTT